jgi:SAM-dependent methyltransferase
MRFFDRLLQRWRARMARPWIPAGARVLDIGCHQGEFLRSLGSHIGPSIGIDPLAVPERGANFRLMAELFRAPMPFAEGSFNVVVMLATLEHIRDKPPLAQECFRLLAPGGRIIITVPSTRVDAIIDVLRSVRLVDGMSLEEHHGYDPRQTPAVFGAHGFRLEHSRSFQLGLNYLFVLHKAEEKRRDSEPLAARSVVHA